jgi:hypothetical protein
MERCTERIHVVNDWKRGHLSAYLYGFDIDKADLKKEHTTFLYQLLADIFRESAARIAKDPSKVGVCHIWLLGTASRSGTFGHNAPLSKSRASSVRRLLEAELRNGKHPIMFSDGGASETVAFLKGKHDGSEDPLDRSVLLVAQWHTLPNPRPPVVKRPEPSELPKPLFKKFRIRSVFAMSDSFQFTKKAPIQAQSLRMELEIMDVYRGEVAKYGFDGAGPALDFTPDRFAPKGAPRALPGLNGPWHDFQALSGAGPLERYCDSFAGGAMFEEFSILHKSWAAFYFYQWKEFPMKYLFPIRPFETGIPPELKLVAGGMSQGTMVLKRKRQKL